MPPLLILAVISVVAEEKFQKRERPEAIRLQVFLVEISGIEPLTS